MGYLLKEGLKTLCGVNQWSYAVFWKIGCQNPKLLIWEECYYEPASYSGDDVHSLVNKMMMDSHVNIVGKGLVGRVAFTGNHQWIQLESYSIDSHPPEVLKEVYQQFSAGMQTIAVIPVLPHGVVQFGSSMTIMENLGFINDVTSLVLQLGYASGALMNYEGIEHAPSIGVPVRSFSPGSSYLDSNVANAPCSFDPFNYAIINGVAKAEVIPSSSDTWRNQKTSNSASLDNGMFHQVEPSNSNSLDCFTSNSFTYSSNKLHHMDNGEVELHECNKEMGWNTTQAPHEQNLHMGGQIPYDDAFVQTESVDDLFDILGADFKNKLFNSCWSSCLSNESAPTMQSWDGKRILPTKKSLASSEYASASQANTESGIFSSVCTDHLLEAEVFKTQPSSKQRMDDNLSCRTTSTGMSPLPYGRFEATDHLRGDVSSVNKYLAKEGAMSSCSLTTGPSKDESRFYSQGSSISWMEKDQKAKPSHSVSTAHSMKGDEIGKAKKKRLKPGKNPRPRPKDRQLIQDRVKELREIVPNGAKCSIDALLEMTIKHMLFLQSVTQHADKLNQTGHSKITSKDGGLLVKDNYEGGATWAYEIGPQSMSCPIIVEDLNQPRQMLVEMLCEEHGMFLEIADIIRGLGLTILKGVMETRHDKIWVQFSVEANRDVTRMEIFMSLVHKLEQSSRTQFQ